ncbi:hypothetical protein HSB1_31140 [Halogranum salarium B-1]|uniref:Uncharacterized protein n=1 Tax=Halogranum salarium B-1 TaxID=1210908 RepID=J3JET1_9EURY|nr:hypothetical protein HSB1_31140 [Halogranum salarium B-1]
MTDRPVCIRLTTMFLVHRFGYQPQDSCCRETDGFDGVGRRFKGTDDEQ